MLFFFSFVILKQIQEIRGKNSRKNSHASGLAAGGDDVSMSALKVQRVGISPI